MKEISGVFGVLQNLKEFRSSLLATLVACSFFEVGIAGAESVSLEKGSYNIRPVRVLEIISDEPVVLTEDTILAADSILIDTTIVTNGFQLRLDARTIMWGKSGELVAFVKPPSKPATPPQAPRGQDGTPFPQSLGSPHSIRNGKQGPSGVTGNPGVDGHQSPQPIILLAINSTGELRIDARGQMGGRGGDGGMGGNGGNGVRGRDGRCSCGSTSAWCSSPGPSPANNGGTNGNGGKGGKGGTAGMGGNAVPLILAIGELERTLGDANVQVGPGSSGEPGDPGKPGKAGAAGRAGRPDGCCADVSFFGLVCEDASGAGAGQRTSYPNPGDWGKGEENRTGGNLNLAIGPIADYAYGTPITSPSGAANGFGVGLDQISDKQEKVFTELTSFNVSRTFAYLLRRSIAIAESTHTSSGSHGVVSLVIADLWQAQFVEPLQASLDDGTSLNPEQARFWVLQGQAVVQLFGTYENSASQTALDNKFREVARRVDIDAQSVLRACASYTGILSQNTDKLLLSHQISVPVCYQIPNLNGIQLIVAPLEIREQLPPLPAQFERFELNEQDVEIVQATNEENVFKSILGIFVGAAHAQSITVEIDQSSGTAQIIDPRDVRLGLGNDLESRYVIESLRFSDEEQYPVTQLGTDLRIFGSVVR